MTTEGRNSMFWLPRTRGLQVRKYRARHFNPAFGLHRMRWRSQALGAADRFDLRISGICG